MSKIHVLPSVRIWLTRSWSRQEGKIMKKLNEIPVGQTVVVKKITGEGPVKRRIMDMGITKGIEIYVRKVAPLGDPIEITVRGYELSLRKADATMIEVE
jgi:ferrous iron transport protein A